MEGKKSFGAETARVAAAWQKGEEERKQQEAAAAEKAFQQELVGAQNGTWDKNVSFFKDADRLGWQPTKESVRNLHYLQELQRVYGVFVDNRWRSTDTGAKKFNSLESSGLTDGMRKALKILGLSSDVTSDEAKKKYREFMMKNHPDRNSTGLSGGVETQVKELTESYPALEEYLGSRREP